MRTIVLALIVGISAFGAELDLSAIRTLVESKKVTSKVELLRLLPPECKKYYTLVYASRATPCASFEKPRVLMTCTLSHANFILAFEGDSPTAGRVCEGVEIIETSPGGTLHAAEIHFTPGLGHKFIDEPQRCHTCHGKPMKHLADQYPNWPGYYESTLRNIRVGSREFQGYQAYKQMRQVDPLYSQLELFDEDKGAHDPATYISFRVPRELTRFHSVYFNHLGRLNDRRAGMAILGHPDYPKYRHALAGAMQGCRDLPGFLPPALKAAGPSWDKVRTETTLSLADAGKRAFEKLAANNTDIEPGFPLTATEFDRAVGIFYLVRRMGFDPHCFSTTISRAEVAFPVSAFTPQLPPTSESCEELREKSLAALEGVKPGAGMTPSHTWDPEFLFQRCVTCHEAGNIQKEMGAPPIPFAKNAPFQLWLDANPAMTHKIRQRVKDEGRLRMPPVESLHAAEKEAIYRYLDGG